MCGRSLLADKKKKHVFFNAIRATPLDDEQSDLTEHSSEGTSARGGYLVWCCMKSRLENRHDGHVEEEQDARVDVHWPIMAGVEVEVKGRRAVSRNDDVLQPKEPKEEQ